MTITLEKIANWFTYHLPQKGQVERYTTIRQAGADLAICIINNTPDGADRNQAIQRVREAIMYANAAIACCEKIND
jgi:hypothetical protein